MKIDNEQKLLRHNIDALEANDLALVSYLGSGSSLLGGILIELGIDYIEGYQEKITPGNQLTDVELPYWREHWPQLLSKYSSGKVSAGALRLMKAHCYPSSFASSKITKAVLLLRDPRDAVISYYNWRCGFSKENGSLLDFLARDGYFGLKPFSDWANYNEKWRQWGEQNQLHIIRFEDLKFHPQDAIRQLLDFLHIEKGNTEIERAITTCSFQNIRKAEDMAASPEKKSRIFRKGMVGEWRTVLQSQHLDLVTPATFEQMKIFGYQNEKIIPADSLVLVGADPRMLDISETFSQSGHKAYFINWHSAKKDMDIVHYMDGGPMSSCHLEALNGQAVICLDGNTEIIRAISGLYAHMGWAYSDGSQLKAGMAHKDILNSLFEHKGMKIA